MTNHREDRDTPLEEAWTIPAPWYFDPDHHALEMDRVFRRAWQPIGRLGQLAAPGSFLAGEAAGEPILAVRGKDGTLRAFHNVCRHRGGTVVRGEGSCSVLQCTYHGWTYALDGACVITPEMEGTKNFDRKAFGLVPVRCEAWDPCVFVNCDPGAPPLAEVAGRLAAEAAPYALANLTFRVRDVYTIACNWKVYVDNFLEGYHIPRAHPGLNRLIDYARYEVALREQGVVQVAPPREAAGETSVYLWLWPNFMINLSYGYVQTNLVVPEGAERTRVVFDYYFDETGGAVSGGRIEECRAFSDAIQQEDIVICESVQKNLHSRSYTAGRYCARRESGLWHFHRMLRGTLLAGP